MPTVFVAACLLAALLIARPVTAGTLTSWTGGSGTGDWSTASNWSTIPTTSGGWDLVFGGTTVTTSTNTIGPITVDTLAFTNDGSTGKRSVFSLTGGTLALVNATITTSSTNGGTLANAAGDSITSGLQISGSNVIQLGSGHNLSLAPGGVGISGNGSLTITGGATLYMGGFYNSYTGGTLITGGQVRTGPVAGADGSNSWAFGTGSVTVSGSGVVILRNASALDNTFVIGGVGLTSSGTMGALRGSFSTSNRTASISGSVTLSADALITSAAANGITGGVLQLSNLVTLGSNTLTLSPDFNVTNGTRTQIRLTGGVAGTGSVVVEGLTGSRVLLGGSSSYTGGTTLRSGTLAVGNARALGVGPVAVNGGVLDLNGQALSIGTLSGSSGGHITSSVSGTSSVLVNQTGDGGWAGSIGDGAGVVGLTKSGTGTLYASGSNSYSGGTTVTAGQIRTAAQAAADGSNNNAFGTGDVTVSGSGSVAVVNATSLTNNFWIGGEGLSSSGTAGAIVGSFGTSNRTATISGTVTLSTAALIKTEASAGITNTKLVLAGPIDLGSNTLTLAPGLAAGGGASSIVLTGTTSGTGDIVVDGLGDVYINGVVSTSGSTTVRAGALGGSGTIAGVVTIEDGGSLALGNGFGSRGTLSVDTLQMGLGATAAMSISGTLPGLYDQIVATNEVVYGGNLALDLTSSFPANSVWQLFSGLNQTGHFSSITAGGVYGGLTFVYVGSGEWEATGGPLGPGERFSFYEDNSHAVGDLYKAGQLVYVPEPSTIVLAGMGLLVAGWSRWTRRRSARRMPIAVDSATI